MEWCSQASRASGGMRLWLASRDPVANSYRNPDGDMELAGILGIDRSTQRFSGSPSVVIDAAPRRRSRH